MNETGRPEYRVRACPGDGKIFAELPPEWMRILPTRKFSDEYLAKCKKRGYPFRSDCASMETE